MKIRFRLLCVLLALLLSASFVVLFAGCGKKDATDEETDGETDEEDARTGLEKYPKNSSYYNYTQSLSYAGGYDEGAKTLRNEILNAPNTEDIYDLTGKKVVRISKDTTWKNVRSYIRTARETGNNVILLERGGCWRVGCAEDLYVNSGVILGCYGEGEKPKLYGSSKNYAGDEGWKRSASNENIWTIKLDKNNDVGNIVFDEIACLGVRKWTLDDVKKTYDFYFNASSRVLYLYYPDDLTTDFTDIEIGQRATILQMYGNSVVDNLCLCYTGSFAITAGHQINNVTVTNCEIGFIGGSQHHDDVRYGNGIQLGMGSNDSTIKHNWVYQCYDAGITFQSWSIYNSDGSVQRKDSSYHNLEISENLIEFCCYNIEFFTTNYEENGSYSDYKDIRIINNVLRFSGYEWAYKQRPDPKMCSQIRGGQWAWVPDTEDFVITGNVFDCAGSNTVFWWWNDPARGFNHNVDHPGLTVEHNTFYVIKPFTSDKSGVVFKDYSSLTIYSEADAREAIAKFDKNPTAVVWIKQLAPAS